MNKQQIYTKVRRHLLRQKEKSLGIGGSCAYRGANGNKCAIGCLIPNSKYREIMEGSTVCGLCVQGHFRELGFQDEQLPLLMALQEVHDLMNPDIWEERLNEIAERYNLSL